MLARVDARPRRRNAGRPAHKVARSFLQWLRGRPCLLTPTGECWGKVEAAHYDRWGDKGMGTKNSDCAALPLCQKHHREQTDTQWPRFQTKYQVDPRAVVMRYWRAWPGRVAWERENGAVLP